MGLLEDHLPHVDSAHLDHQFAAGVLGEQGIERSDLGLEGVESLLLATLALRCLCLTAIGLDLLGVLRIDGFLDHRLAFKDGMVRVDLTLEGRDVGIEVLAGFLEVLGVLPVERRCIEVSRFVLWIGGDDLVIELACTLVVLIATEADREAELARDVSRLGGCHCRERLEAQRVIARVYRQIAKIQVGWNIAGVELGGGLEFSDGGLLVAHHEVGHADIVVDAGVTLCERLGLLGTQLAHLQLAHLEIDPREVPISANIIVVCTENHPNVVQRLVVEGCSRQGLDQVVSNLNVAWVCIEVLLV